MSLSTRGVFTFYMYLLLVHGVYSMVYNLVGCLRASCSPTMSMSGASWASLAETAYSVNGWGSVPLSVSTALSSLPGSPSLGVVLSALASL